MRLEWTHGGIFMNNKALKKHFGRGKIFEKGTKAIFLASKSKK